MSHDFRDLNPYASPAVAGQANWEVRERVRGRVTPPAIGLCGLAVVGLGLSIFNVVYALLEHKIDPQAPEFVRGLQQGAIGPLAAMIQGAFVVVNSLILLGAMQMMRMRTWPLAVTAAVLAMINFSSCCCVPGI